MGTLTNTSDWKLIRKSEENLLLNWNDSRSGYCFQLAQTLKSWMQVTLSIDNMYNLQ